MCELRIFKRNSSGFSLFGTFIPIKFFGKMCSYFLFGKAIRQQPIFMLFIIVFQKLVGNNDIFSDQLAEIFYVITRELAVVCDHFKCKFNSSCTGLALAKPAMIIGNKMFVKFTKHF